MASSKKRLDLLLVEKGMVESRQKARSLIMAGQVIVDTIRIDKPGTGISPESRIVIKGDHCPFVSRGGLKLEGALKQLELSIRDLVCMDVGASTGGFTDCLLTYGAKRVYAVDVGYGQLAWKLRQDPRVVAIERTNIRHMPPDRLPEPVDLITVDASFISLRLVVPPVLAFLKTGGRIIALIKPQFEVGKGRVGKGGVVRDEHQHAEVIETLTTFFKEQGLVSGPVTPSPILGPKGNREFIILLTKTDSV